MGAERSPRTPAAGRAADPVVRLDFSLWAVGRFVVADRPLPTEPSADPDDAEELSAENGAATAVPAACGPAKDRPNATAAALTRTPVLVTDMQSPTPSKLKISCELVAKVAVIRLTRQQISLRVCPPPLREQT